MRERADRTSSRSFAIADRVQLLAQTTAWVAAWLIFPVWLGLTGAAAADFATYALGAGAVLAVGTAFDQPGLLPSAATLIWAAAVCWFTVLVAGGALFGIASLFH
jgi:hypothetical protein